eukprot:Lithocolla_globosa_v1_NODE_7950_length_883_cov_4.306763.p3 type:complete len:107 gc:universal NODE_7950_length_883_cov_4.306763:414-94(-)
MLKSKFQGKHTLQCWYMGNTMDYNTFDTGKEKNKSNNKSPQNHKSKNRIHHNSAHSKFGNSNRREQRNRNKTLVFLDHRPTAKIPRKKPASSHALVRNIIFLVSGP